MEILFLLLSMNTEHISPKSSKKVPKIPHVCLRSIRPEPCSFSPAGHAHVPYPDTEYEYFEHRGNIARPMMAPPPGQGGPGPAGVPLLPPVKYNEEVRQKWKEQVVSGSGSGSLPAL